MPVITIAHQRASGGQHIARRLAEQLGYVYVDRRTVDRALDIAALTPGWRETALERHGATPLVAAATRELLDELRSLAGSSNQPGSRRDFLPDPDHHYPTPVYAGLLRAFVQTVAEYDHAVILGRGANFILVGRPDAIHVLVLGSRERRIVRLAVSHGIRPYRAAEIVLSSDRLSEEFIRQIHGRAWPDPAAYDLVFDTDSTPAPVAVGAIAATALALPGAPAAVPSPA